MEPHRETYPTADLVQGGKLNDFMIWDQLVSYRRKHGPAQPQLGPPVRWQADLSISFKYDSGTGRNALTPP